MAFAKTLITLLRVFYALSILPLKLFLVAIRVRKSKYAPALCSLESRDRMLKVDCQRSY